MKADPAAQQRLLDVQALDARLDHLRHQRAHLPEAAEIAELQRSRDEADGQRRDAQIRVDDLSLAQRKADNDVEQVKTRRTRDRDRMDQGLVTSPKDLERMSQELVSLERRISTLEDEELEIMQQLEDAQAELAELEQRLAAHDERLASLAVTRDEKTAAIDAELAAATADREPAAGDVPDDLLALYDKLRANKDGVGAAELRARQCGGCRLSLDHAEIERIRGLADDEVVRCEECQRILVRTPESGL